ncbi:hypothetical protein [Psychrobacillus sp.]|uniref:hypothetical protein n=1 Tax=Psychrobacillus sp. TaxID=1871623 RepID=UPI0028BF2B0B|nr:hypothetical protein [Psychrobacillus sp.]
MEYEKLDIYESSGQEISSIAQYLLAPFILVSSSGILDIPINDYKTFNKIVKEIAPHFNKVVKITTDENQIVIRLQNLRESSKVHFMNLKENRKINAVVSDIYIQKRLQVGENHSHQKNIKLI